MVGGGRAVFRQTAGVGRHQTLITCGPRALYRCASWVDRAVSVMSVSKSPTSENRQKLVTPNLVWMPTKTLRRETAIAFALTAATALSGTVNPRSLVSPLAPITARSMTRSDNIPVAQ